MRYILIDEMDSKETDAVKNHLRSLGMESNIAGLFWLPVPQEYLEPVQAEHAAECGPHVMALDVRENDMQLELLVRAQGKIRCECVRSASEKLSAYMLAYIENMAESLKIRI